MQNDASTKLHSQELIHLLPDGNHHHGSNHSLTSDDPQRSDHQTEKSSDAASNGKPHLHVEPDKLSEASVPPYLGERRKSSIFMEVLRHAPGSRRGSTASSRLATFLFGDEKTELEDNDEDGHDNDDDPESVHMRYGKTLRAILIERLFLILSGMYGITIVVLGAVIPLTDIFAEEHSGVFDGFYIFLYSVSIIFLAYVYAYLLRRNRLKAAFLSRTLSRTLSFTRSFAKNLAKPEGKQFRSKGFSVDQSNHHTGTFYLRLGVLGFGIGSMIHSGLNFGKFFGVSDHVGCNTALLVIKPVLKLVFTFSQLYFIFMNSKMCIHRYKKLARFGLMHMAGTNVCMWFRCIVVETMHEIHRSHGHHSAHGDHVVPMDSTPSGLIKNVSVAIGRKLHSEMNGENGSGEHYKDVDLGLSELECQWTNMMGTAVEAAAPYLYPCTIEFSLMCAGILYVMWKNVGRKPRRKTESKVEEEEEDLKHQRMSVDCTGSSRGLFLGILLTVSAIISIIAFYVMVSQPPLHHTALLLTHLSEILLYIVTTFALGMASMRMRQLAFHSNHKSDLEETLILISYTGLLAFNMFSLIASVLQATSGDAALTIISNLTMMIQASCQTIFMLAGDRMSAANKHQERKKPGREFVTFLLLCNFAMWIINTFETQKPEHNPLQVQFYGPDAWSIFSHISVPLGIYYRFHSTVCLSNIWKNAWKNRKHHE